MPLRKAPPSRAAFVAAGALAVLAPTSAHAGSLSSLFGAKTTTTTAASATAASASGTCVQLPTTKAFQRLDGDSADYSLAPGGDFESGAQGWTLSGSAAVTSGNESLGVSAGSKALRMPIGSTATSPSFCIDETNPHFRFAYKVDSSGATGFIAHVVYKDARGAVTKTELLSSKGLSLTPSQWQASPNSPLATIIPLNATSKSASVQIKFSVASPADLSSDIATTVVGDNALSSFIGGITGGVNQAINVGVSPTAGLVNLGVTIDSVMVDPYRRG
ncbi:MAG: hypothetical protein PGN13_14320 [Patulibacter minatonensis]